MDGEGVGRGVVGERAGWVEGVEEGSGSATSGSGSIVMRFILSWT